MALPKPAPDEDREDFIERFMSNETAIEEYPREEQRLAVANSIYDEYSNNKSCPTNVTKYLTQVKELKDKKRQIEFTISTVDEDRDGDVIRPEGATFKNFMKNPVVLFAHNSKDLPIGRAVDIKKVKNKIKSIVEFLPKGVDEFADKVYTLVKEKFLNSASIGFSPKDYEPRYDKNDEFIGWDIKKWELREWSIVPVPANPKALSSVKEMKAEKNALLNWAKKTLDDLSDDKKKNAKKNVNKQFITSKKEEEIYERIYKINEKLNKIKSENDTLRSIIKEKVKEKEAKEVTKEEIKKTLLQGIKNSN